LTKCKTITTTTVAIAALLAAALGALVLLAIIACLVSDNAVEGISFRVCRNRASNGTFGRDGIGYTSTEGNMASGEDFLRYVGGTVRKVALDRVDDAFAEGFKEAANISVEVLSKKMDDLLSRIKAGNPLSDQEQYLLVGLHELKSETEQSLRAYWIDGASGNQA
jgi:hypothetical protein